MGIRHEQFQQFKGLIGDLNRAMILEYYSMSKNKNPIARRMPLEQEQLLYVLGQYTKFPAKIVSFLDLARESAAQTGWNEAEKELTRNMGEELGTRSHGITHYQMLLNGLQELCIDVLIIPTYSATEQFISAMTTAMKNSNPAYVAGAIYACESSAVPELEIVVDLTNSLFTQKGKIMSSEFKTFFELHLNNWEPGHEQGLQNNLALYIISKKQRNEFEYGFRDVMCTMDQWWNGLYKESLQLDKV